MTTAMGKEEGSLFDRALEEGVEGTDLSLKNDMLATEDLENISSSHEEIVGHFSSSLSSSDASSDESSDGTGTDTSNDGSEGLDDDLGDDIDEDGPTSTDPIRSKHEIVEEPIVEVPDDFEVTPDMRVSQIGTIQSVFENNIIIRASVSGEQRVLEEGAIFCLEDRKVLGILSEVFGPVRDPFYRVSFPTGKSDISELAKNNIGKNVYVVVSRAHWIDTFELKLSKGTDASNGFDEELPEDEQEFSDDEKEAQFKRMNKNQKKKKAKKIQNSRMGDGISNVTNRSTQYANRINGSEFGNNNTSRVTSSYRSRKSRQLAGSDGKLNDDADDYDDSGDDSYDPFRSNGLQPSRPAQNFESPQYGSPYNSAYPQQYPASNMNPPSQFSGTPNFQNGFGVPFNYASSSYMAPTPMPPPPQFQHGMSPQPYYGVPGQYPVPNPSVQQQVQNYYPQVQNPYQQNQVYEMHQVLLQRQQQQQQQQNAQGFPDGSEYPPY